MASNACEISQNPPTKRELAISALREEIYADPVAAAKRIFGFTCYNQFQGEVISAPFRHRRTVVTTGHATGKTESIGAMAGLWMLSHPFGFVLLTAATYDNIESKIMPVVEKTLGRCVLPLKSKPTVSGWRFAPGWEILAINPAKEIKAQGWHSDGGTLVIADEATDLEFPLHTAFMSSCSAEHDAAIYLTNPTRTDGPAFEAAHKWGWHSLTMSALDVPNVRERKTVIPGLCSHYYVDEVVKNYGLESWEYKVRVMGEWPTESAETLISAKMLSLCVQRPMPAKPDTKSLVFSVDVARSAVGDDTVLTVKDDAAIWEQVETRGMDEYDQADWVLSIIAKYRPNKNAFRAKVRIDNSGGYGSEVTSILTRKAESHNLSVEGYVAQRKPDNPNEYFNLRTEAYWRFRCAVNDTLAMTQETADKLKADCGLQFKHKDGKMIMELKPDFKERTGHSPDHFDSASIGFMDPPGAIVIHQDSDLAACKYHDKPVLVPLVSKPGEYGLWPYRLRLHEGAGIVGEVYRATWWDRRGDSASLIVHRALDGVWTVTQAEMMPHGPSVSMESFAALIDRVARDGGGKPFDFTMDVYGGAHDAEDGEIFYGDLLRMYLERARKDDSQGALYHVPVKYISGMAGMDALLELVRGTKKALDSGTAGEMLVCYPDEVLEQIAEARYKPETKQAVGDVTNTELIGGGGALVRCLRMLLVSRSLMG